MNYKRLVAIFLLVASFSTQAAERWFEVELLIFKRTVEIKSIQQYLLGNTPEIDTSKSLNLLTTKKSAQCLPGEPCLSVANPTVLSGQEFETWGNDFKFLDASALQLSEQRAALEEHDSFTPVLHMAWRMPMVSGTIAQPLHIFAGQNLAVQEHGLPIVDQWEIDGNFKIYLDHFLYIDSQLTVRKVVTEQVPYFTPEMELIDDDNGVQIAKQDQDLGLYSNPNSGEMHTVVKNFLFDQRRRLRSEEVHYLDNPLMGVIVQIRKIPASEQ